MRKQGWVILSIHLLSGTGFDSLFESLRASGVASLAQKGGHRLIMDHTNTCMIWLYYPGKNTNHEINHQPIPTSKDRQTLSIPLFLELHSHTILFEWVDCMNG
jgi:hypothetical protein